MPHSNNHSSGDVSLGSLLAIFYSEPLDLARFEHRQGDRIPEVYQRLLNHSSHMTVTVESFYEEKVNVQVLRSESSNGYYCREILLSTHSASKVVQYGIVRLKLDLISQPARSEILAESKPLGRVLIEREILREVELFDLYAVACGPKLAEFFGVPQGTWTYGRTAIIHCDGEPAIELLEIVAPTC